MDFDSIDQKPSQLFFLVMAPENSAVDNLKLLGRIVTLLKEPSFKRRLMEAPSRKDLFQIISEEDEKVLIDEQLSWLQELEKDREHRLELTLMAGRKGLNKKITHSQVQKMGLALTGFIQFINPERLQIIGNTEMAYFKTLAPGVQEKVIHQMCSLSLSCLVITRGLEIPELLLREADEKGIPVFRTNLRSFDFIEQVTKFLEEKLASYQQPPRSAHGCLWGGRPHPWQKWDREE